MIHDEGLQGFNTLEDIIVPLGLYEGTQDQDFCDEDEGPPTSQVKEQDLIEVC